MWNFFATVRNRHSIRKYQPDMPIEPEKLHAILEMACAAPSAGDLQSYRIIVVTKPEQRLALSHAAQEQKFISEAPVCLIFCTDAERSIQQFGERGKMLYTIQDATISAAYAQLAVVAAGLGSTWIGHFDEKKVTEIAELPENIVPVALLSLGYPAEIPEPTSRRPMEEVIFYP